MMKIIHYQVIQDPKKCCNRTTRKNIDQNLRTDQCYTKNQTTQRGQPYLGCKRNQTHQRIQKAREKNITVTQEDDEDAFEYNANKIDKENSDN